MIPLADLLPHTAPMILLSGYEPPTAEDAVTAYVDVTPASPFFESARKGVPSCVALEYMAQTMALLVGLTRRRQNLSPQVGFVLGSRKLETRIPLFKSGSRYRITSTCTYADDEFGAFDCQVADERGDVVGRGTLTAFQPGNGLTEEEFGKYA